jgi:hypothetical protein
MLDIVRCYFHDRDSLEPISRDGLLERLRAGAVTVLDVRPEDEFALAVSPLGSPNFVWPARSVWLTFCLMRMRPFPQNGSDLSNT